MKQKESPNSLHLRPRLGREELERQRRELQRHGDLHRITAGLREGLVLINSGLQILFANRAFTEIADRSEDELIGLRIGEAVGCANSSSGPGGCGTSEECSACRVLSGLTDLNLPEDEESATLFRLTGEALHFSVSASPFTAGEESFRAVTIRQISQQERKSALERIFYHDILNSAGVLRGLIGLLRDEYDGDKASIDLRELWQTTALSSARIVEEIQAQRDLSRAERNELHLNPSPVDTERLADDLIAWFTAYELAPEGRIRKAAGFSAVSLITDPVILQRVLINLVKNAVESSSRDSEVVLESSSSADTVTLGVRNRGVIADDVRRRIFRQTFSTKGKGRGFGTYSVKLLSEQYLQGRVGFVSTPEEQTLFYLILPRTLQL